MKELSAVVPVRKGSQRVKDKSLRPFNKKNLLRYKIEKLKKLKNIDEIIVNTDSEEAIQIAKDMDVSYFKRAKFFASADCSNSMFWENIADTTESKYIMFTNCTSPLVKLETYKSILDQFLKIKNANDSLNTVTPVREFLYFKNKALNFDPSMAPNSQNLPDVIKLNFAVNIISKKMMKERKSVLGLKPFLYHMDAEESYDIDTMMDFQIAEHLHKKNNE